MSFELKKREPIPDGIRRVVCQRIDRALETFKNANGAVSDHAVHDVRKRFKEIRGTLRLVRDELGEKTFGRENRDYRDAGRPLSLVRDAKVLIDSLDQLIKHAGGRIKPQDLEWLRRALLDRHRDTRQQTLQRDHAVKGIVKTLRSARSRVKDWPVKRKGWRAIKGGLRKGYVQGRRAMKKARAGASDDALHEWRKRTKDLRYQLELLTAISPRAIGPLAKQAKHLTDLLGDDHDLCVLCQIVREIRPTTNQIEAVIAKRRASLQKEARALGKKLYADPADDFMRRLHDVWKTGRKRTPAS